MIFFYNFIFCCRCRPTF